MKDNPTSKLQTMVNCCTAIVLLLCTTTWSAGLWESPQAWKDLHRKMTESQVTSLLGSPKETETVGVNLVWYYQDVPRQKDGQAIWRPKTAFVHFKQIAINGENLFMLYGWKPPYFEQAPPPPLAEDTISPDNPLAQLEQIERVYMEQLQLADPENFNAPTPTQPSPNPPAALGLSLPELFNKCPRQWVFIGVGSIFFVTTLALLWPRRHRRRHKDKPQKQKKKWEVDL
jgi:outer membrane protein assembly factor BamE (lipoprotein component of BamABCDE complex)